EGGGNGEDGDDGGGPGFISFPEEGDIDTSLEGDTITFSAPIIIHNDGLFPIEDFVIDIDMKYGEKLVFQGHNDMGDIPGGESAPRTLEFSTSVGSLVEDGLAEVLFQDLEMDLLISVGASYLFGWIGFELHIPQDMEWEAPVGITVDGDNIDVDTSTRILTVPVIIDTAEWVVANVTSTIELDIPGLSPAPSADLNISLTGGGGGSSTYDLEFTIPPSFDLAGLDPNDVSLVADIDLVIGDETASYKLDIDLPQEGEDMPEEEGP
ncbi:MAG: hypothetical protein KAT70_01215, partial [Thermoplasmata archaeon]|nr:hypothetical protein [Thermoplasmata archaeon]